MSSFYHSYNTHKVQRKIKSRGFTSINTLYVYEELCHHLYVIICHHLSSFHNSKKMFYIIKKYAPIFDLYFFDVLTC